MQGVSKSQGRKDTLDRFYTPLNESQHLMRILFSKHPEYLHKKLFIEPSAGQGSFLYALKNYHIPLLAYDIKPSVVSEKL